MMECALCGRGHWKRRPLELGVDETASANTCSVGSEAPIREGGADARPPHHAYHKEPWQRTDGVATQLLAQRGPDFEESDDETDVDGDDGQWSE